VVLEKVEDVSRSQYSKVIYIDDFSSNIIYILTLWVDISIVYCIILLKKKKTTLYWTQAYVSIMKEKIQTNTYK